MSDAAQRLGAKYFRVTDFNDVKDLPRYVESLLSQPPPPVPQPPFMPPPGYPPPSVPYGGGYPGFHGDALLPPPPPQPYMQEPARREDDRSRAPLWPDAPSREPQHQSSEFDRAPPREPRSGSGPFRATMCKFFLIGRSVWRPLISRLSFSPRCFEGGECAGAFVFCVMKTVAGVIVGMRARLLTTSRSCEKGGVEAYLTAFASRRNPVDPRTINRHLSLIAQLRVRQA
jgi:hypothetical protein